MKKRVSIISSIVAFASAMIMLAFGIYAANSSRSVEFEGTIAFTSNSTRANVKIYTAKPYAATESPIWEDEVFAEFEFFSETGKDSIKPIHLGEINLDDLFPNYAFQIVIENKEQNKYINLEILPKEIVNSDLISFLLNREEVDSLTLSLKPGELSRFVFEYHVDAPTLNGSIEENFGTAVFLSQGSIYTPTNQNSEGVTQGLLFELNQSEDAAVAKGVDESFLGGALVLPDNYIVDETTYPVTEIKGGAFQGKQITSLSLGLNVEIIKDAAFASNNIERLYLHNKIDVIEGGAFNKSGLSYVFIEGSGNLVISGGAFSSNPLVDFSIVGKGASSIDNGAISTTMETINHLEIWGNGDLEIKSLFSNKNIGLLVLGRGVKMVINGSFVNANISGLTIYEGLEEITDGSFGSSTITRIVIPGTIKVITNAAFSSPNTTQLIFKEGKDKNLAVINNSAFSDISNNGIPLSKVVIPESVKEIATGSFDRALINDLVLEEGFKTINHGFVNAQVINFTIPDSLEFSEEYSSAQFSFHNIFVNENSSLYKVVDNVVYSLDETTIFFSGQKTKFTVLENVESISPFAFYQNKNLTNIIIESGHVAEDLGEDSKHSLLDSAVTVYIKQGLQTNILSRFEKQETSDMFGYVQYLRQS